MTSHDAKILSSKFDCVVFLTWSDWKTEPRSNRYHFASRFAQHLPLIFIQPDLLKSDVEIEATEIQGLSILHVFSVHGPEQSRLINKALLDMGFIKPLLWIYNPNFVDFIRKRFSPLKVFHATENYFTPEQKSKLSKKFFAILGRTLSHVDLLVAVSEEVLKSYIQTGPYLGETLLLPNGCDYKFWALKDEEIRALENSKEGSKIAIYQGGINYRLDWDLLQEVFAGMPDWEFWLCGQLDNRYQQLIRSLSKKNVKYLGNLDPDQLRTTTLQATVGLIPFVQNRLIETSLPLKTFEYVACGLPVVSVPISALELYDGIISFASNSQDFIARLKSVASTRFDIDAIQKRLKVAKKQDYDDRFLELIYKIEALFEQKKAPSKSFNIAVLYDPGAIHVATITEHLQSFSKYSRSQVLFIAATNGVECAVDLGLFDVLVIHYSVRVCYDWHISPPFAREIKNFGGYKVLFVQDEYDTPETTRNWIEALGIHVVFTCVPEEFIEKVYPSERFPSLEHVRVLTGYVPSEVRKYSPRPIADRKIMIGYRGRSLPYYYGDLGREKVTIAQKMRRICEERGLEVDIEWKEENRIYGDHWYEFVQSLKATLGTESGSNVFDDYGDIKSNVEKALGRNPSISYDEIHAKFIGEREGHIKMNQISPRIFEAIAFRTALVLFEGDYSNVIQAGVHYISLKKDFSNIDEVLEKIADDAYLENLTKRAYKDIILSKRYSYKKFIQEFDEFIAQRLNNSNGDKFLLGLVGKITENRENIELVNYFDQRTIGAKNSLVSIIPRTPMHATGIGESNTSLRKIFYIFSLWISQRLQRFPRIYRIVQKAYRFLK